MAFLTKFRWAVSPPDLNEYIGRAVKVKLDDGKEKVVEIERLVGSLAKPWCLQVTSRDGSDHLISMLDFFAQMNGEKVTDEEIKAFNETLFEIKGMPKINGIWRPTNGIKH